MTPRQIIGQSQYFNVREKWGNPDKMNPLILQYIINARNFIGFPFVINSAFREGDKGQHGLGNAVDWAIIGIAYPEAIERMERWLERTITIDGQKYAPASFVGFGLYPYWNRPGFHLDCRGTHARWAFDKNANVIAYLAGRSLAFGR